MKQTLITICIALIVSMFLNIYLYKIFDEQKRELEIDVSCLERKNNELERKNNEFKSELSQLQSAERKISLYLIQKYLKNNLQMENTNSVDIILRALKQMSPEFLIDNWIVVKEKIKKDIERFPERKVNANAFINEVEENFENATLTQQNYFNLGTMFFNEKKYTKAWTFFTSAEIGGDLRSSEFLKLHKDVLKPQSYPGDDEYQKGIESFTNKDYDRARYHLEKAKDQMHPLAKKMLETYSRFSK